MSFSEIPIFEMNRKIKKLYKSVLVKESESIATPLSLFQKQMEKTGSEKFAKKTIRTPNFPSQLLSLKEGRESLFVGSPLLLLLSSCYLIKWKLFYFEMTFRNPLMPLLTFCCTTIVLQISLASPLPSPHLIANLNPPTNVT